MRYLILAIAVLLTVGAGIADTEGLALDDDGDSTFRGWGIEEPHNPTFIVLWDANTISGFDWTPDSAVTITIDNDDNPTTVLFTYDSFTDEDGFFEVGGDQAFDIQAGHYVVVTDGTFTKDHRVADMMFVDADRDTDIVTGTAEPGSVIVVELDMPLLLWEHLNFQFGPDNRNPDSLNEYLAFRQAVAHAIDREAIVAAVPGAGFAIDSYVQAYLPDLSQDAWAQYEYDPTTAQLLIDGLCADLDRDCVANPPVAVFTTSEFDDRVALASLLAPMLDTVGIQVEIDLEDQELFWNETFPGGTFDVSEWAWVGSASMRALADIHYSFDPDEQFDQNFYNWGTPDSSVIDNNTARMAELVGLMGATDEPALLADYIQEAELILADEIVFLPLYVRDEVFIDAGPIRVVEADEFGNWIADFSVPWEDQEAFDITAGTAGSDFQFDEGGDATGEGWEVPPDGPVVTEVAIDVKPGGYPNSINIDGRGVIPVAVLGSESFDVTQIDTATLDFAGFEVKANKKGKIQCAFEDVSGEFTTPAGAPDGHMDLVCQFVDDPDRWSPDDGTATLTGLLLPEYGGTAFSGSDDFRLVPVGSPCRDPLGCVQYGPNDPIVIGAALALTGLPEVGSGELRGLELALNRRGEMSGHSLAVSAVDARCSPEGGVAAAEAMVADPDVVAVVGTSCSSSALEAAQIVSEAGYSMVSPSNTGPALTDPATHSPGYLRVAWNEIRQATAMAEFARSDLGFATSAIIHQGDLFGEAMASAFVDTFTGLGGTNQTLQVIDPAAPDIEGAVAEVIAAGPPDVIYTLVFAPTGIDLVIAMRNQAALDGTALATMDGLATPEFVETLGEAAEGIYRTAIATPSGPSHDAFLDAYVDAYGEPPISQFDAYAFDAASLILDAVEQTASSRGPTLLVGRQALRDALFGTSGYQGVTGTLTCDAFGDCASPTLNLEQVQEGEFVQVAP